MFRLFALIIALTVGSFAGSVAADSSGLVEGSPAWIVNGYFVEKDFPAKNDYLTGEMERAKTHASFGATLPDDARVTCHELRRDDTSAVFTVNVRTDSMYLDMYCFLRLEENWKIHALRSLALPQFVWMLIDSLRADPDPPDSMKAMLASLELLTSSDSALAAHVTDNLDRFNALVETFRRGNRAQVSDEVAALGLDTAFTGGACPGCIFFLIGGILDNEAGYIYAEDETAVPCMSSDLYILVLKIAPHWFLYKTT